MGLAFTISREMSGSWRWASGFFSAFRRSFTATWQPTSSGAPERRMYPRMIGAK